MNIVTFFTTNTQTPLIEQPIKGGLNNVTKFAKTAAIFGVAFGNQWFNLSLSQRLANLLFSIVGTIREHFIRTPARAAKGLEPRRDSNPSMKPGFAS
jgi:hypothetical protein